MARRDAQQSVETGVELVSIGPQRGIGELRSPSGDGAGALEQLAQAGREGGVAGLDSVLGIADEMGEADLMVLLGPIHLGGEAVGNPEVRAVLAQELFDHGPAAVGVDDEAGVLAVMEHPGPPGPLADPHAGFVGFHHVRWVVAVIGAQSEARITLTYPALDSSREVA